MSISLHHIERLMPHKVLHVIQRNATLDKPRCKPVTQIVKTAAFKARFLSGF